jgi:hypothetical protein
MALDPEVPPVQESGVQVEEDGGREPEAEPLRRRILERGRFGEALADPGVCGGDPAETRKTPPATAERSESPLGDAWRRRGGIGLAGERHSMRMA